MEQPDAESSLQPGCIWPLPDKQGSGDSPGKGSCDAAWRDDWIPGDRDCRAGCSSLGAVIDAGHRMKRQGPAPYSSTMPVLPKSQTPGKEPCRFATYDNPLLLSCYTPAGFNGSRRGLPGVEPLQITCPAVCLRSSNITRGGLPILRNAAFDSTIANANNAPRMVGDLRVVGHQHDGKTVRIEFLKHLQNLGTGPRIQVACPSGLARLLPRIACWQCAVLQLQCRDLACFTDDDGGTYATRSNGGHGRRCNSQQSFELEPKRVPTLALS